jgi:hypothetical protein
MLATDGTGSILVGNNSFTLHLIIDVNGWFE